MDTRVKDPVCGMSIDPDKAAAKVDHGGVAIYFCSPVCKSKFESNPASYVKSSSNVPTDRTPDAK